MGGSKIFAVLFLGLFSLIRGQPEFGDSCIGVSLCSKASGLVCGDDNTCVCTYGAVTSTLQYSLAWDVNLKKCFGQLGSACVGTPESPNAAGVECAADLTCVQATGLPVGLGACDVVDPPKSPLTFGETCNSETYCDKAAGLICDEDFKCGCSNGAMTQDLNFVFEWNAASSKCFASLGSACVGTKQTPIVASSVVQCVADASCEESPELGLPVGVGVCKSTDENESSPATEESSPPTTPPTTTTTQSTSTPPSGGIVNTANVITLTLAGFIAFALIIVQ